MVYASLTYTFLLVMTAEPEGVATIRLYVHTHHYGYTVSAAC